MNDFVVRQIIVLRRLISDYREGRLDLNTLIQRIEGLSELIDIAAWKEAIYPIILSMEQINAVALESKLSLDERGKSVVEDALRELDVIIDHFQKTQEQ